MEDDRGQSTSARGTAWGYPESIFDGDDVPALLWPTANPKSQALPNMLFVTTNGKLVTGADYSGKIIRI